MRELAMTGIGWAMGYLVHSALVMTVLVAVAWAGDRLLRRVGPEAQHGIWVTTLLLGVTLPLLPAGWLAGLLAGFGHAATGAAGGTVSVTYSVIAAGVQRWTPSPLVEASLGAAYLAVVLGSLAQLLWRYRRARALAQRAVACDLDGRPGGLLTGAARQAGVAAPPVLCSVELRGPVVMGWRLPLLLVPESFFLAEEEDIAAALAHECAHLARRDFAKNLIYDFAAAMVAYHPATWMMRRRIGETRELICDEMASGTSESRAEYATSLLRLAQGMATPRRRASQAIGVFDANILEERIMRLTMDLPKVSRTRSIVTVAVAACALLGGAMTAAALSFDLTPQTNAAFAGAAHEKVYKVGNGVSAPVLVHSVDAEYSKKARDAKYQGVSVVSLVVDTNGMPQHVRTARKLGMGLDEKAIEAVRQYRFKPSMLNGKPVAVAITIEVSFRIY